MNEESMSLSPQNPSLVGLNKSADEHAVLARKALSEAIEKDGDGWAARAAALRQTAQTAFEMEIGLRRLAIQDEKRTRSQETYEPQQSLATPEKKGDL